MNKFKRFRYNPFASLLSFVHLRLNRRISYPQHNIGKELSIKDSEKYRVFLEIDILNSRKEKKQGSAVFQVIFHSARIPLETVIQRTRYTIPLFSGLPGFCTKQFMVNEEEKKFSGRYEWETVEKAQNYARSYALKFMKRRSSPFPVYFEISDKNSGKIIESRLLETGTQLEEQV